MEDICDFIKPEVRKKTDIIIVHAGTNDITNNTKSFENYKITDTIKVTKLQIRNFQRRHEKRQELKSRLSKFCSKNKIDATENKNLDGSCLNF